MTRSVLLIDDDPKYRKSVVALFEGTSYRIVEAASPAEGIAKLDGNPDLRVILLDLSFPGVSGTAVLDYIARRSSHYRVIVLTGHDELLAAEQAGAYDVFNYLPKAEDSAAQSILFSVARAFDHLDHADLARKTDCLLRAQEKITRHDAIDEILDFICECVCSVVGAYTCHIRVYDFKHGDFHVRGFGGPDTRLRALFGQPKAGRDDFSGEVVRSRTATAHQDLQNNADFLKFKVEALARSWEPEDLNAQARTYFDRAASAYIAPIFTGLYGNLVDAVLNVSSVRPGYFTEEKQGLVNEFVNQAALAITKDWLQKKRVEAHQDYGKISDMLAAVSQATRAPDPLKAVYQVVTERIAQIVRPEIVSIFRYDESTGIVKNVAEFRGGQLIEEPEEQYPKGLSLTGHVVKDNETIHLPLPDDPNPKSPTEDERFDKVNEKEYLQLIPSREIKHYLGVPIRVGGRVRGVIRAVNKKSQYYDEEPPSDRRCLLERGFSLDCRNALEIAANHLAAAIHNVELLEEKDRQVGQIRTLGEVGRLINSEVDIKDVLDVTIRKMRELMHAEICMLFLRDEETERIVLEQALGIQDNHIPETIREIAENATAAVADRRRPCLMVPRESTDDPRQNDTITSLMAVPIQARDHLVGVMTVINKDGDRLEYDRKDLDLFQTFADYVGGAIENAQILKRTNDRLAIEKRNSALSRLVSAVAHEINNTSGVIPANVEGLREYLGPAADPAIRKMLEVIEDAASQASDFATELAGFSVNRRSPQKPLDINKVIREAVDFLGPQYRDLGTTRVELPLADTPLVCKIFRMPFIQVARNIVINAIQALDGKQDGYIRISTRKTENGEGLAEVRFEDNGPGIKPEYHERIFDPEFSTKPKGNGLGLWLARMHLQAVDGTIDVDPTMTHGAAFIVRIPLSTLPESTE